MNIIFIQWWAVQYKKMDNEESEEIIKYNAKGALTSEEYEKFLEEIEGTTS